MAVRNKIKGHHLRIELLDMTTKYVVKVHLGCTYYEYSDASNW